MLRPLLFTFVLALGLGAGLAVTAAEEPAKAMVAIEGITLEPSAPTATTLCRLKVKLASSADKPISMLRFKVTVSGHDLPVYGNQVFLQAVPASGSTELQLYNFWVSETGRPAPADGKLTVEVTLVEAQLMKVGPDADGVETWEPLGPVPGLPMAKTVTTPLKKP